MGIVGDFKSALGFHQDDFMRWAFGPADETKTLQERWNALHPDLFALTEDQSQEEILPKMVEVYLKSKTDTK